MKQEEKACYKLAQWCRRHGKHPHVLCSTERFKEPCPFSKDGKPVDCTKIRVAHWLAFLKTQRLLMEE